MGLANAFSCKDDVDASSNNHASSIVPDPIIINVLDLALFQSIAVSTSSDLLILWVISALQEGFLLFSHFSLSNWTLDNGYLYFKDCMYIPPPAHSPLLHSVHSSSSFGHMGIFHTKPSLNVTSGGQDWHPLSKTLLMDVPPINKTRSILTSPSLPVFPSPYYSYFPSSSSPSTFITNLPSSDGHDSIVVIVDHGLMKGVILTPCSKTIDASGITQIFLNNVFKHFGLYDTLISDQGP